MNKVRITILPQQTSGAFQYPSFSFMPRRLINIPLHNLFSFRGHKLIYSVKPQQPIVLLRKKILEKINGKKPHKQYSLSCPIFLLHLFTSKRTSSKLELPFIVAMHRLLNGSFCNERKKQPLMKVRGIAYLLIELRMPE